MIKSLPLLMLRVLTLKNLTLNNYSLLLLLALKDLLITVSLTLILTRYITSFIIRAAIIIIRAPRLRNIIIREKTTNIIIITERIKCKKIKII